MGPGMRRAFLNPHILRTIVGVTMMSWDSGTRRSFAELAIIYTVAALVASDFAALIKTLVWIKAPAKITIHQCG